MPRADDAEPEALPLRLCRQISTHPWFCGRPRRGSSPRVSARPEGWRRHRCRRNLSSWPSLAATGLSVPLPNVVERFAAALVPWAEPVALESSEIQGASGTIVPTAGETASATATPQAHGSLPATASRTAPGAKPASPRRRRIRRPRLRPLRARPRQAATQLCRRLTLPRPLRPPRSPSPPSGRRPQPQRQPMRPPRRRGRSPARRRSGANELGPRHDNGGTDQPAPQPTATTPVVVQTPIVTVPVPVPTPVAPVVEPVVTIVNETVADPVGTVGGIVANPGGTVGGILKPVLPKLGGK